MYGGSGFVSEHLILDEAWSLLCGQELGNGTFRVVYACRLDSSMVVKVEREKRSFHNVEEYNIWNEFSTEPQARWLAPCKDISPCGRILLQARVKQPVDPADIAKLPDFLMDVKSDNFGWFEGRIVTCDYGIVHARLPMRVRKRRVTF